MGAAAGAGAGLGILSGAVANSKEGGRNAGNIYDLGDKGNQQIRDIMQHILRGDGIYKDYQSPEGASQAAAKQVQTNPLFGQLFGPQGTLSRTAQQEQDLSSRGFSLQPEDYEAYGQESGNIARMFGSQEQGLAQALADRGLSNSGVATQQFAGMYGNKQEQLAQLQRQIANDRMKMNLDRLQQTRSFLGTLGGQAQSAYGQQFQNNRQTIGDTFSRTMDWMKGMQGQHNNQLDQELGSEHASTFANVVNGGIGGAMSGARLGMGGGGPMSGATLAPKTGMDAVKNGTYDDRAYQGITG
jgi:hypothetical protein